ncbi:putative cross-wall-targeting lipoprotein signal domain-containing proteiin, partial [Streptococcus pluranimalium]|uniref:putative cross-wall-targeting lipoprotein signal domain-containing proteiin n=1 Tax=Streptococcus pluranimalium TaxID=82348 RepID=UPI0039EC5C9F
MNKNMKTTVNGHGFFRKSKAYGLVCGIVLGVAMLGPGSVSADEVTTPATQPTTEVVASTPEATPAETPTITSDIPTSVSANTTQDQAVKAVDEAQATLKNNVATAKETGVVVKEGETQEVVINDGNASEKTSEVLADLNEQDKKVKEATAKQADNLKAYAETTTAREEAVTEGQANLATSTSEVDKLLEQAKKAGLLVSETTTDMTPEYADTKGLTGDDLRKAMADNLSLYKEAINAGIAIQGKSVEDIKRALALYANNQKAYTESKTARDLAVSEGQASLSASTADVNKLIDQAKKAGLLVTETTTDNTPAYKDVKALTGDALRQAMAENLNLYKEAINAGIAIQGKSVENIKRALALYANNQKAYTESKTARDLAVSEGQATLQKSTASLNEQIDIAKKNDLTVNESTTNNTPQYKDTKDLTGEALKVAMAENIKLYNEAVKASAGFMDQSTAQMKKQIDAYILALADYQKGIGTNTGLKWQNGVTLTAGVGA